MAASNNNNSAAAVTTAVESASSDELAAKLAHKRFEGLVTVRRKAIKGKGAWYWAHLEPILVHNSDTGVPKSVKLRCSLCDSVFSASNPSRTASEHLKRGTCLNFSSKQTSIDHVPPLTIVDPSKFTVDLSYPTAGQQQQLVLSGGREDLGALAMLEDSVKRLKSPKPRPGPSLSKAQADSALDLLADWVYDNCGSVALSSIDHPKFKAFLNHVGLPAVSRRDLIGARLDAKYAQAKAHSEAKIRDAMFFQIAADGWKSDYNPVHLAVNLPNGTNVFRKAVFTASVSDHAEEILWDTIVEICGSAVQQCVGIVSDRFKTKALKNLEDRHRWMVNITCQHRAFNALIKDFGNELPLFKNAAGNCLKLASFINSNSRIRHAFHKYQLQEYGHAALFTVPLRGHEASDLIEDIIASAGALQLLFSDESYKEEPARREIEEMRRNPHFWNEVEAVHSLVKLIKSMAQEIEAEKPRMGQCLPLWEELRVKVKEWCSKFHIAQPPLERIVEKRFKKNYHPSWAAAFVLDPLYLIRDATGKYLPPFKCLTSEQEKDVDRLITRMVSREEAHVALMELMKWRSQGLDPVYAQAVQLKQRDPSSGKMRIANPQSSRLVWETYLSEFKSLGKVAVRLIFLHATSCALKLKRPLVRWAGGGRSRDDRLQKMIFIAAHSKMERIPNDDDKDAELFALENGEDDVLNEVFVDTSSV
ncbi:hypothetical protein SASPL_121024 [Salvia splendens]|uniref:DUF7963 domain-containing protein n=2 Tax=Salvia splendens TaxID=180675 RepID=A0A8X8XTK8_SALSN|nr:uncharacterized protein LOC121811207 isoform X2 [Salvia splendens]KAG6418819.1 hypothetical protein SASPL_121024 [Salvia splendens]